jgi:hypothetical protein
VRHADLDGAHLRMVNSTGAASGITLMRLPK